MSDRFTRHIDEPDEPELELAQAVVEVASIAASAAAVTHYAIEMALAYPELTPSAIFRADVAAHAAETAAKMATEFATKLKEITAN